MRIKLFMLLFASLASLSTAMAQEDVVRRGDCMPDVMASDGVSAHKAVRRMLPTINKNWNPEKVYKQAVILISFSDTGFSMEKPLETYDSIFNVKGYNQRQGVGCVADYFRDQSAGLFNVEFDVFGPYQVSSKSQPYDSPNENTRNYGSSVFKEAVQLWLAANPYYDYTQYDWDGNGYVNQVIFVYAGYTGNQSSSKSYGRIWPNTSSFSAVTTPDSKKVSAYTSSAELWTNDASCGIGTICHEFSHSLGLPDIYPVGSSSNLPYSMVDEWDLMDGGNFTNYGWCPPNWSPLEKMLLGWLTPVELSEPATITGLKTIANDGDVYQVKHTDNEYLLLENRQREGWDLGLPGKGLVVYHVNYINSKWSNNTVNGTVDAYNYSIIAADTLNYAQWVQLLKDRGVKKQNDVYQNTGRLNSWVMSSASYPLLVDSTSTVKRDLTDTTVPAVTMFGTNAEGSNLLGKPITNIVMAADGTISFDFMGGSGTTGVTTFTPLSAAPRYYDLQGRRRSADGLNGKSLMIVRESDGTVRKIIR